MKISKPLRWNIETAAREFGINPRTVTARLTQQGIRPDPEDHLYSTQQIASAVFSDYDQEKTRLTKAQADQAELNLSVARKEVVPVDIAFQTVSNMLFAVRRVITTSTLPPEDQDAILKELQGLSADDFVNEAKFEEGEK